MRNCCTHSKLELRGPRNGVEIGPRSSRGVHSVPSFAPIPNPTTEGGVEGCLQPRMREVASSKLQSSKPQSAQSFASGAREGP
eukprot:11472883-Alexandrium_andersonii.AAC.1